MSASRSSELISLCITAALLSQQLAVTCAMNGSILDSFPLNQLVNVPEKNLISGHYGFITCAIFQAAGFVEQCSASVCTHVSVCVSEWYQFDCVMETFPLIFSFFPHTKRGGWLEKGVQNTLRSEKLSKTNKKKLVFLTVFSSKIIQIVLWFPH